MVRSLLRIGEIAQLLGVTPKTVRHYHKLCLLPEPERSEGGYRLYSTADLFHLRRIRRMQSLGLSLQQIKFILDDDDPDTLLQTTLEGLQQELTTQLQRIEARRQRIEHYLAEGVSLVAVEALESPSPTYQMLQSKFGQFTTDLPETVIEFDKQMFAHLDAFDWGSEYTANMTMAVDYFEANPQHLATMMRLSQCLTALQTMPEDDPQIKLWADEIIQTGIFAELAASMTQGHNLEPSLNETLNQIITQNVDQHLTPAQRLFLELLTTKTFNVKSNTFTRS